MRRAAAPRALAGLAAVVALLAPLDARACGTFRSLRAERGPGPERERVLVVFDAERGVEHLVREVTFRAGTEPFAFVIPVPGRPELGEVTADPFPALAGLETVMAALMRPMGAAGGAPVAPTVVQRTEVAGFEATVLAGGNAEGVTAWLREGGFRLSGPGSAWIARAAARGLHFVALRYQAPTTPGQVVSRALRVSFPTTLPWYPYAEPLDTPDRQARTLEVWVVAPWAVTPLSTWRRTEASSPAETPLGRPWDERWRRVRGFEAKLPALGVPYPAGGVVQHFRDEQTHRDGWGDVVLTPAEGIACDAACVGAAWDLAGLADPRLTGAAPAVPAPAPGTLVWRGRAPLPVEASPAPIPAPPARPWWRRLRAGAAVGVALAGLVALLFAGARRRGRPAALAALAAGAAIGLSALDRRHERALAEQRAVDVALAEARAGLAARAAELRFQRGDEEGEREVGRRRAQPVDAVGLPADPAARGVAWAALLAGHRPLAGTVAARLPAGIGEGSIFTAGLAGVESESPAPLALRRALRGGLAQVGACVPEAAPDVRPDVLRVELTARGGRVVPAPSDLTVARWREAARCLGQALAARLDPALAPGTTRVDVELPEFVVPPPPRGGRASGPACDPSDPMCSGL